MTIATATSTAAPTAAPNRIGGPARFAASASPATVPGAIPAGAAINFADALAARVTPDAPALAPRQPSTVATPGNILPPDRSALAAAAATPAPTPLVTRIAPKAATATRPATPPMAADAAPVTTGQSGTPDLPRSANHTATTGHAKSAKADEPTATTPPTDAAAATPAPAWLAVPPPIQTALPEMQVVEAASASDGDQPAASGARRPAAAAPQTATPAATPTAPGAITLAQIATADPVVANAALRSTSFMAVHTLPAVSAQSRTTALPVQPAKGDTTQPVATSAQPAASAHSAPVADKPTAAPASAPVRAARLDMAATAITTLSTAALPDPAAPAAPGPAVVETPTDFATLVDQIDRARNDVASTAPPAVGVTLSHADFGRVSLQFTPRDQGLAVTMRSADPGFAPAVVAAAATHTSGQTGHDAQAQNHGLGGGSDQAPRGETARQGKPAPASRAPASSASDADDDSGIFA